VRSAALSPDEQAALLLNLPVLGDNTASAVLQAAAGEGQPAQLYILSGEGVEPLPIGDGAAYLPALSPSGDMIAFLAETADGTLELRVLRPAAGAWVTVLPGAAMYAPAWSPGGQSLLVTLAGDDGAPSVYTVAVNDLDDIPTPELLVTDASGAVYSPSGRYIAFERAGPGGETNIYVAAAAKPGAAQPDAGQPQGTSCTSPAFGPDSMSLYFACDGQLYRYSGGAAALLDVGVPNAGNPAPGPGAGFLAFDDGSTIYYARSDGTGAVPMLQLEGMSAGHIHWPQ
jgi:Tol biopolymer transport system component